MAVALIAAGATSVLTGTLLAYPGTAAPSSFIELDGNVRSDATLDWARSGGTSGTNGAFDGGLFVDATTPPTPPAATTTLTGAPGFVANTFAVDPLDVDTTVCGAGDPTVFTGQGGEKNGDRIDGMTFSTASVPNKDDLSNVYAVVHRPTAATAELFFGAERVRTDGDSHVDFELLHATVSRGAGCSGSFAGNRSQGDLLVSVDYTNGGALAGTSIHQWHCADEADPQPADGTVCDPPANGPSVPHYEDVSAVPAIAAAVTVRVNDLAAVACGGWACRAADGTQVSSLPVHGLVEGGIDLSASGFTGCTATLLPHTRTSQSFTATLKDFTGPMPIDVCSTPHLVTTSSPTGGNVPVGTPASDEVTVTSGGAPVATGTVAFFLCQPAAVTAAGCPSPAGTQIGAAQPLDAAGQASPVVAAVVTSTVGKYCWRAEYTPAQGSGLFAASHTNAGSECFTTVSQETTTSTSTSTTSTSTTSSTSTSTTSTSTTSTSTTSTSTTSPTSTSTTSTTTLPFTTLPPTTTTLPPTTTVTSPPASTAPAIGPSVLGVVVTRPPAEVGGDELPRTGTTVGPLLVWAGMGLSLGGALVLGARRPSRRPRR